LEWRQRARRLLVERFGSVESGCDSLVAPLRLLELCFGEFMRQVNTECSLPCPHPYSLMEYVDAVADALDEYLLGDEDLVSLEMGFLDDSGFLRSFLLLQRRSSMLALDYCDGCSGWGQLRMSLHRVFSGLVLWLVISLGVCPLTCWIWEIYGCVGSVTSCISPMPAVLYPLVVRVPIGRILGLRRVVLVVSFRWLVIGCWIPRNMCCFVSG